MYVAHRIGRLRFLQHSFAALFGRQLGESADFDVLCVKEVSVETQRRRVPVSADGEVMTLTTPLYYRVRPGALRVIVPASSEEGKG